MSVEVAVDSPLAVALNTAIQPKLIEVGWSTGEDSALSEYIILMLANGKTQEQIAAELSGDLLNLGEDDPGAMEFARWLFNQVVVLKEQENGGDVGVTEQATSAQFETAGGSQDADMGDAPESGDHNVYVKSKAGLFQDLVSLKRILLTQLSPTGPKSMRNGPTRSNPRDKRMLGHLAKAMDRSNESVLHRVRPQNGNERINSHSRGGPPAGPRGNFQIRGQSRNMMGSRGGNNMGPKGPMPMQQGAAAQNIMNMSPQQQLDLYAMLEQQSRLMAQMLQTNGPQATPMGQGQGFQQQQPGRSLFDRVPHNSQRGQHGFQRGGHQNPRFTPNHQQPPKAETETPSSSMDVEMSQEKKDLDPENTTCRFNLTCTNKECKFAHQSPAAPPGTTIDFSDICSFGAACMNRKCTGKHPSPSQKLAHQTEQDCKFFPNCTNPRCPFKHPSMPPCRNGADCTTPNCKFTHTKTMCKFDPCLNPSCVFKHAEGQKRGKFADKVWTADGEKEHVSERKFVDDEMTEELIVPGASEAGLGSGQVKEELIT